MAFIVETTGEALTYRVIVDKVQGATEHGYRATRILMADVIRH